MTSTNSTASDPKALAAKLRADEKKLNAWGRTPERIGDMGDSDLSSSTLRAMANRIGSIAAALEASNDNAEDIIDAIIAAYRKYEAPVGVDAENRHPEFWIQCAKTGLAEIQADLSPANIKKEFADLAFIAIDGLYKMGYNPKPILLERLEQNQKKDLSKRNMAFYAEKEVKLRPALSDLILFKLMNEGLIVYEPGSSERAKSLILEAEKLIAEEEQKK